MLKCIAAAVFIEELSPIWSCMRVWMWTLSSWWITIIRAEDVWSRTRCHIPSAHPSDISTGADPTTVRALSFSNTLYVSRVSWTKRHSSSADVIQSVSVIHIASLLIFKSSWLTHLYTNTGARSRAHAHTAAPVCIGRSMQISPLDLTCSFISYQPVCKDNNQPVILIYSHSYQSWLLRAVYDHWQLVNMLSINGTKNMNEIWSRARDLWLWNLRLMMKICFIEMNVMMRERNCTIFASLNRSLTGVDVV